MNTTEKMRELFSEDTFATRTTGINIDYAEADCAVCSMEVEEKHLNALGIVMGGAIYTLADFAIAVAANSSGDTAVTLSGQISYLNAAKGKKLTAKVRCLKSGRSTASYIADIVNDKGVLIASVTGTCFKKSQKTLDI